MISYRKVRIHTLDTELLRRALDIDGITFLCTFSVVGAGNLTAGAACAWALGLGLTAGEGPWLGGGIGGAFMAGGGIGELTAGGGGG